MNTEEFAGFRKRLGKTQKEISGLLGVSIKAVCSYEQGWRNIPAHVERQVLFLVSQKEDLRGKCRPCWAILSCPPELKENCPAWEFKTGLLCWFINGTICNGVMHKNWAQKIEICKSCPAFPPGLRAVTPKTNGSGDTTR